MLRFERNELDFERYELRRMGKRLRLARGPMELLMLLIERRNLLVTRQEIASRLWSEPEAVDVVQGINSAINRLRAVLNDDPGKPRFIETVIGKGYRFIADVDEICDTVADPEPLTVAHLPTAPAEMPAPVAPVIPPPKRIRKWLLVGLAAAIVLSAAGIIYNRRVQPPLANPVFTQLTFNDGDDRITASGISPDGRLLAYSDSSGILLRVVQTGAEQLLASPPSFQVDRISWFPDDLRLAVSGYQSATLKPQVWLVFVTGKPPRLLHDLARNGVPSPDGNSFAYTSNQDTAIWVDSNGGEARTVFPSSPGLSFPYLLWSADSKRLLYQRKQYAPSSSSVSGAKEEMEKQYRWAYESADPTSGKVLSSVAGMRFDSACFMPGGRLLFMRWDHVQKRQSYSIWEVKTSPSDGSFQSSPRVLATFEGGTAAGLSASSDGYELAAIWDKDYATVSVANLPKEGPDVPANMGTAVGQRTEAPFALLNVNRLTHNLQSDYPHAWMPGSGAVLFESNRSGTFGIYRQQMGSRTPEMIAGFPRDSILPQVAPGGKWILFAVQKNTAENSYSKSSFALYRIPTAGGTAEEVPIGGPLDEFRCPLATSGGCVLRQTVGHQELVYYALDPLHGKGAELGRTTWSPTLLGDWDVSPDASAVAFPIHDSASRSIRIVPLKGPGNGPPERKIEVAIFAEISEVTWAANGKGFYAGATTDAGCDLLYIDLQGRATVLKKSVMGTWGVPSPDGSKLAFVDYRIDSNVWISRLTSLPLR